jgi:hypothetical protein
MSPLDSQSSQSDRSKVPPPPPSYDQQVGVRNMESDMQSIQQSGGESPQSQIMSANEVFKNPGVPSYGGADAAPQYTPPPVPTPASAEPQFSSMPSASDAGVVMEPPAHKSSLRTILLVVGIVIIAAAVGYGVYYLIGTMKSEPNVPVVPVFSPEPLLSTVPSPAVTVPLPSPLTHISLISSPAKTEMLALTAVTLADFKTALAASSAKDKLLVGTVKDLSFATEAGQQVTTQQFLQSFFPSSATNLSFLFEQDFTAWLYGDKVGGNKFGVILQVKPEVSAEQLQASLTAIEASVSETGNMFMAQVGTPEQTSGFKSGPVEGISVRYLAFSAKDQQVFEYAPVQIGTRTYVVIATSYYQMQHILKLLSAKPAATPAATPAM